jgi:hypothetical protein
MGAKEQLFMFVAANYRCAGNGFVDCVAIGILTKFAIHASWC